MRVLIVGCGYVGMALGRALAGRGHRVSGLRRSVETAGDMRAAGIEPVAGDITDLERLARLPRSYDWVVNCVSSSHGGAEDYRKVYYQGTRNLLAWLAPAPPEKFVYTSSSSVYGQADGSWVDETSATEPQVETASILLQTEQILLESARQRDFPAVILRVAGIYGPGRGYWFKQFLSGAARLEGNGGRWLNLIHRDDVVGAIIAALEKGRPGEVYNAVDNEPVTQLGCFQWLARRLNRNLPPALPGQEDRPERKRAPTNKRISNRRLRVELGYQFKYPTFREGFEAEMPC